MNCPSRGRALPLPDSLPGEETVEGVMEEIEEKEQS
jgi:hypothetical protein